VAFLKEWVRGLVLLVLLGGCLEMLLPMGGMKRYVRLVLGLLVMLAMVRPVLAFLGQEVKVDFAAFVPPDRGLPTLSQIMADARRFQLKNRSRAIDEVRQQLQREAAGAARSVGGVAAASASVQLQDQGGELSVEAVTVVVTPGAGSINASDGGPSGAGLPVRPVLPVQPVRPVGGPSPAEEPAARAPSEAERNLAEAVRREVAARLGLRADSDAILVLVRPHGPTMRR
jgi:stage III sporulation protein AF